MEYLIISAATEGSHYAQCLSLQRAKHGNKFKGFIVKDRGNWHENTKIKPEAIRRGFCFSPVVMWIDADCDVNPPEELPAGNWDIGTIYNVHPQHKIKTSAGFILLRDTKNTRGFLAEWDRYNRTESKDHPAMMKALYRTRSLIVEDVSLWLKDRHSINKYMPERGVHEG